MVASDVITLDSLSQKLPQWRPDDESHIYAIVDMGSNGIRFSITSLAPPTTRLLTPIFSTRAAISLFDALTPSPSGPIFSRETISDVASTLSRFHNLALLHGVPSQNIVIMATEAMRRAANAAQMLDAIAGATQGLGVHILDPAVETLFGAVMGSRSGLINVNSGALFLDLGGGSVQMTWVDTSQDQYEIDAAMAGVSLPFGAARLIRVLDTEAEAVRAGEINKLQSGMQDAYAKLCSRFPALQATKSAYEKGGKALVDVYMCGGGFRGYGSMLMHNDSVDPYPIASVNTYTVPGSFFKQTSRMRRVNTEYEGKIFGLSKRRRHQFPAILTVIEAFIATVPNIRRVTFCGGSNRDGVLMMKLPREIRESDPLEVLASVTPQEKGAFAAMLQTLSSALPHEIHDSGIPTVLSGGLGLLFIRDVWSRQGYDSDSNTSFALHHAVTRDAGTPGLSHFARALLALAGASRWGGSLSHLDVQLYRGLEDILESRSQDASFWAQYLGAIAAALATVFPVFPASPDSITRAIRIDSHLKRKEDKKDKVIIKIDVDSNNMRGINQQDLADKIEGAAKKNGGPKPNIKISAQFNLLS